MDMRGRKRGRGREGELGVRVCWDVGEREGRYEVFFTWVCGEGEGKGIEREVGSACVNKL